MLADVANRPELPLSSQCKPEQLAVSDILLHEPAAETGS